jgi:hypothetical protein
MSEPELLEHLWQTVGQPETILTRSAFIRLAQRILQQAAEWQQSPGEN